MLLYLVGPSGVGKDAVLTHLKNEQITDDQPLVAHRYITRPVRENDENHVELLPHDFSRRKQLGLFLFDWQAHGKHYAIGKEVLHWSEQGAHVILNGSRSYLPKALKIYPSLMPIFMTVSEQVLRERLTQRGRESSAEIEQRIARNSIISPPDDAYHLIHNNQSVEHTAMQIIQLTRAIS